MAQSDRGWEGGPWEHTESFSSPPWSPSFTYLANDYLARPHARYPSHHFTCIISFSSCARTTDQLRRSETTEQTASHAAEAWARESLEPTLLPSMESKDRDTIGTCTLEPFQK